MVVRVHELMITIVQALDKTDEFEDVTPINHILSQVEFGFLTKLLNPVPSQAKGLYPRSVE